MLNKILNWTLIILLVTLGIQNAQKSNEINKLSSENFKLSSDLIQQIEVSKNNVIVRYKIKDRIVEKKIYINEGKTIINTDKEGKVDIKSDWYGLCFKPWLGLGISSIGLQPAIGSKIAFIGSFGADLGVYVSPQTRAFLGASINIYSNTSIGLGYDGSLVAYGSISF